MRRVILGLLLVLAVPAATRSHDLDDGDFAVGYNEHSGRPGILIAWRNTQKIFEAEVLVKNLGHGTAKAFVNLEIVGADGRVLLRRPEAGEGIPVSIRGYDDGGTEGTVVQILGSPEANQLIDRLDREKLTYTIQSRVTSYEGDTNTLNNVAGKTLNAETQISPGSIRHYQFSIANAGTTDKDFELQLEKHGLPEGWSLDVDQALDTPFTLDANSSRQVTAKLSGSSTAQPIARGDLLFRVLDLSSFDISMVREWFVSSDKEPPKLVDKETIVSQQDGNVYFEIVAYDAMPGLKEGSAARLEYSSDGGFTFSDKIMAYADGDFTHPTRFTAELGPFKKGTKLKLALVISDSVGNTMRSGLPDMEIGAEK